MDYILYRHTVESILFASQTLYLRHAKGILPFNPKDRGLIMSRSNKKEVASITCSFKLTPSEWLPYQKVIDETQIKKGTLLANVFRQKADAVNLVQADSSKTIHPDIKRMNFLINKSSNNLNQIAHKINSAYRSEIISEKVFIDSLNKLVSIESLLDGLLKNASKN